MALKSSFIQITAISKTVSKIHVKERGQNPFISRDIVIEVARIACFQLVQTLFCTTVSFSASATFPICCFTCEDVLLGKAVPCMATKNIIMGYCYVKYYNSWQFTTEYHLQLSSVASRRIFHRSVQ